jgi:sec-independent protein translocase protein TatA
MGGASIWHWVVVGGIVMLLFGRGKISEMMGDVAKGIKAFKKGMSDDDTAATTTTVTPVAGTDPVRNLEHRTPEPAGTASTFAADRKVV